MDLTFLRTHAPTHTLPPTSTHFSFYVFSPRLRRPRFLFSDRSPFRAGRVWVPTGPPTRAGGAGEPPGYISGVVCPAGRVPRGRHALKSEAGAASSDAASAFRRPGFWGRAVFGVSLVFERDLEGIPRPKYYSLVWRYLTEPEKKTTSCH